MKKKIAEEDLIENYLDKEVCFSYHEKVVV